MWNLTQRAQTLIGWPTKLPLRTTDKTFTEMFHWNTSKKAFRSIQTGLKDIHSPVTRANHTDFLRHGHHAFDLRSCCRCEDRLRPRAQVFIPDTEARLDTPSAVGWSAALCYLSGAFSLHIWFSLSLWSTRTGRDSMDSFPGCNNMNVY